MLRKSRLYSETEFLSLAQALEAFGRRGSRNRFVPKSEFRDFKSLLEAVMEQQVGNEELKARVKELVAHAK